jgi:uncharacterized membrane-anchored protein
MGYKLYFAMLLAMYGATCCGNYGTNHENATIHRSNEEKDSSILNEMDSFKINSIEFVKRRLNVDTIAFNDITKNDSCTVGYTHLKQEELADEF